VTSTITLDALADDAQAVEYRCARPRPGKQAAPSHAGQQQLPEVQRDEARDDPERPHDADTLLGKSGPVRRDAKSSSANRDGGNRERPADNGPRLAAFGIRARHWPTSIASKPAWPGGS